MASAECMLPEFNLFQPNSIQNQVEKWYIQDYTPISAIGDKQPIVFVANGAPNLCWALHKSFISVICKLVKPDDGNIAAKAEVSVCNNVLHSMFQQIDVELGDKQVSDNNSHYGERAYFENTLCYSKEAQDTWMMSEGFIRDTAGKMELFSRADNAENKGALARGLLFDASKEVEFSGRPHCDLFIQDRAIIPNCKLALRLIPCRDNFIVKTLAPDQPQNQVAYKLKITSVRLHLHVLQISDSLSIAFEKMLQTSNARYPITKVTMKTLTIPANQTTMLHDNLYLGKLPKRLVLALATDASMAGGYQQNPFNFGHFGLNYLVLNVNGDMVPSRPYTPDYENDRYLSVYNGMFTGMRCQFSDHPVTISYNEFARGYAFYVFDLSAHGHSGCHSNNQNGTMRIEAKFAKATTATLNLICYAEFDDVIEIDKYRNTIALY